VFLCGADGWETINANRTRLLLRVPFAIPSYEERRRAWETMLDTQTIRVEGPALEELVSKFKLTPEQIANAVHTAVDLATSRGELVSANDLYAGAQAHTR
jgi:hypothetical protein